MKKNSQPAGSWNRRDLLKHAAVLLWAAPAFGQARGAGQRGQAAGAQRGQAAGGARGQAAEPGTQLVLLGTQGGPGVAANRTQASSLVVVDGRPYMIDCGYGALKALVQAGFSNANVGNIFITHLHDDHTADLAAILALKWTGTQRPNGTAVFGPYGTKAMVDAAIAFSSANVVIRSVDEGRTVDPKTIFSGRDIDAPRITEAFKDDRITVQVVENAHFPDRAKAQMPYRSFAYRFNTPTRSIVFSGDTAYSENLIELAKGADVFVCEVLGQTANANANPPANTAANNGQARGGGRGNAANAGPARGGARGANQANNAGNPGAANPPAANPPAAANQGAESIARHVRETHSTAEEVGKMAAAAKVKTVVLSHQVGGGRGDADPFSAGVKRFFSGEVILGRDQMRL